MAKAKKTDKKTNKKIEIPEKAPEIVTKIDKTIPNKADSVGDDLLIDEEPNEMDLSDKELEDIVSSSRNLVDEISNDSIKLYLHEIGKIPLLEAEEELELAQEIVKYAPPKKKRILKKDIAEKEAREAKEAEERAAAGLPELEDEDDDLVDENEDKRTPEEKKRYERARAKMVEANMRLVVSIAKRYSGRGLDFLDLIQEGNTGLLRAVNKFDPDKGFKFSTYATWWIRQAITRAIADQARTIRIPVHMVETINRMLRTQRRMTQKLNREPTTEELAKEMFGDDERLTKDERIKKVEHIMKIKQDITSLDATVGKDGDEDSVVGDFVEDKDNDSPEDATTHQLLKEQIRDVLAGLSEREQKILKMRFGIDTHKTHTLEEVGEEFDVTRERIRQIEAKALTKMRKHKDSKKLKAYLH